MSLKRDRRVQTTGQNCTKIVKNINILIFRSHIWIRHEKCIQTSTNMPSIGSVNPEIAFEISEISRKQSNFFHSVVANGRARSVDFNITSL